MLYLLSGLLNWRSAMRAAVLITIFTGSTGQPASAAPCVATTLANLVGTSCSIGTTQFSFLSAASDSRTGGIAYPTNPADIWVTPDSSLLNPGFTWSGTFSVGSSVGEFDNVLRLQLLLGVQPRNPTSALTGVSASVSGVNASPAVGNIGYAFAQAESSNWTCSGACPIATATEGYSYNTYISSPTGTAAINANLSPQNSRGLLQFFALAQNGGRVAFDSVSFHFAIAPNFYAPPVKVSEPGSWTFGLAGVSIVLFRRALTARQIHKS
jgi:hypothetical protein